MLAPGEYLIQPPPPPLAPAPQPEAAPAAKPVLPHEEDEPSRSFLMILLRALGVMHT